MKILASRKQARSEEAASPMKSHDLADAPLGMRIAPPFRWPIFAALRGAMEPSERPQRRFKRFRVRGKVPDGFVGSPTRCTADLLDISTNGCLLLIPSDQVKPGTVGRLGIQIGRETLRATAFARRIHPGLGVGFEFSQMYSSGRDLLRRLILSLSMGRPAQA